MAGLNTFGGTIKLQGEKEYRQAITQVNSDLKVLGSELGKVTAEFGRNDKSVDGLNSKNKVLTDQISKQQEKIVMLRGALESSSEKYGENDKKTQNWQISLNKAEAELIKMQKELSSNNQELDKSTNLNKEATNSINQLDSELSGLNGQLEKVNEKYKNSGNSAEGFKEKQSVLTEILGKQSDKVEVLKDTLEKSKSAFGENSTEAQKWQQALNSAEQEVDGTKKELQNLDREMQNASKSTSTFGDMLKASLTAEAITAGIKKLGDGLKSVGKYMLDAISSARVMAKKSVKWLKKPVFPQKFCRNSKRQQEQLELMLSNSRARLQSRLNQ